MREKGIEAEAYRLDKWGEDKHLGEEQLDRLIGDRDYRQFLNTRNELYRERGMAEKPPSRQEALKLMAAEPNLIRRPILVRGKRLVLGFNKDKYSELLA